MLYFLQVAYKGTAYHGWQRQINGLSVQQVLEEAMTKIFRQSVLLHGCGRTDAGVHASQFFAHTHMPESLPSEWRNWINKLLPKDIAILAAHPQQGQRHAQFDATSRTYRYYLHLDVDPFVAEFSTFFDRRPFLSASVQECVAEMLGSLNFRAFCKQPDQYTDTLCEIQQCRWHIHPSGRRFCFEITADRFLRGMVRLLVGNLLEVGTGRLSAERFLAGLHQQEPLPHFKMAHPQGLYLAKVVYPYLEIPAAELF